MTRNDSTLSVWKNKNLFYNFFKEYEEIVTPKTHKTNKTSF